MEGNHHIRILTDIIPSPKLKNIEKNVAQWRGRQISFDQKRWSNKKELSPVDEMLYQLLVQTLLRPNSSPP
jgi:hypothetical protein